MTYEQQIVTPGRQQIWLVEIHVRSCSLEFGVTCPATGTPCFNTEATCPVYASFDEAVKVYRFIEPVENMPISNGLIPSLKSVSITPGSIKIGGGLGSRAVCTVTFADHPHSDIGIDPYRADRDYDPFDRGTFWGKFRARNRYLQGSLLRVYNGFINNDNASTFDYDSARKMDFYIESISVPSSGTVSFVAKDPLKGADDSRAVAPKPNTGVLSADISSGALLPVILLPTGVGAEYSLAGVVTIGGECADFTRSGDSITLTNRGVRGTEAQSHSAGDLVQECLIYNSEKASFIAHDLLTTYAGIDPALIDLAEWDAECDNYLPVLYDACVAKPTAVRELLTALGTEAPSDIFWNEFLNKIQFRAVKGAPPTAPVWSDDSTFLDSDVTVGEAIDQRVSTVIFNFDVINPLGDLKSSANYRQAHVETNTDSARRYGGQKIKTINSVFVSSSNRAAAEYASATILSRFSDTPLTLSCDIDIKDSSVWTSDCVYVEHYKLQDATGALDVKPYQVTSVAQKGETLDYSLISYGASGFDGTEFVIVLDAEFINLRNAYSEMTLPPLTLRDLFDKRFGIEPDTRTVRVKIYENGVLGSSDGMAAITILDSEWPSSTPIVIEIYDGYTLGHGGNGARGYATTGYIPAGNGGTAIFTDRPITILNNGVIGAGGGGGGAGYLSGVGGGGAGYPVGLGQSIKWFSGTPTVRGGHGSLTHGGGGNGVNPATAYPSVIDATLTQAGDGGNTQQFIRALEVYRISAGGGGGGVSYGGGGTDYSDGRNGDPGTNPNGGNGGIYGVSGATGAVGGGGGGGGLGGNGGNGGASGGTNNAGGLAGIAIDGWSHVTLDPLSTGVIIGATIN